MMLQNVSPGALLIFALTLLVLSWLYQRLSSRHGLPQDMPWADGSSNIWSTVRLHLRSLFSLKASIEKGYYTYSKANEAFILPNIITGPEVILPMSQMKWLLEQPDNVLNQHEVNREFLHADKTMLHYKVVNEMVHGRVIRREMTKHIDKYSKAVAEEIEHALGVNWGTDITAWREVRLYDTLLDVVARISNRALVGLPLCRDTTYLKSSRTYARSVVLTAGLLNLLPSYLQHLFGPLIMAYDMGHYRKIASYITPIVNTRALHLKPGLDYRTPDYSKHNDYIQWALHDAYSHDEEIERTPEMIAKRLTVLSFAAIQSSVITATNCVFDIASSPKASYIQDMLREEVLRVSDDNPETFWDKKSLSAMVRIDGALRESMRLWGFISRGVMKKVVSPDGVTLPSGQHLPYGSKVGVTSYAIHHDEAIYQNSSVFEPLRFCTGDEAGTATANGSTSMVTSADDFMAFSHGRHACPGRFFAANQLKLLLAAIVTKYDIEPISVRPANQWLNNTIGPPIWDTIRVRRRM